jgi:hypothetical protein
LFALILFPIRLRQFLPCPSLSCKFTVIAARGSPGQPLSRPC